MQFPSVGFLSRKYSIAIPQTRGCGSIGELDWTCVPLFWKGSTHSLLHSSSTATLLGNVSFASADIDYLTQTYHTGIPEIYKDPGVTGLPNSSILSTNPLSQ
jgi:hypothetical protein